MLMLLIQKENTNNARAEITETAYFCTSYIFLVEARRWTMEKLSIKANEAENAKRLTVRIIFDVVSMI